MIYNMLQNTLCTNCITIIGKVSVWDMHTGQVLHHLQTSNNMDSTHKPHADASENEYNPNAIMWLHLLTSKNLLISVSADHNISMYNLKDLTLNKQVGLYVQGIDYTVLV